MHKVASIDEVQGQLARMLAFQRSQPTSRKAVARNLIRLAYMVEGKLDRTAKLSDNATLTGLLETEVMSVGGDARSPDVPHEVEAAAEAYEKTVEKALLDWVKKNIGLFKMGVGPLRSAKKPEHVVEVMMDLRGGAGFLYYMEHQGAGVGTWDGDWDVLFVDPRFTIRDLSKYVASKTGPAARKLDEALQDAAFELMDEGEED